MSNENQILYRPTLNIRNNNINIYAVWKSHQSRALMLSETPVILVQRRSIYYFCFSTVKIYYKLLVNASF
jgi:hypothetical protein